jgi:3-hydroxyisobutyrate dehydrogenase-like beta-hydroxyacid dehydrogenase
MQQQIGFIGTGNMGLPMARNLLAAGFALRVYDLNLKRVAPLVSLGAQQVNRPCEVVEAGGIVISMVPDDAALEQVVAGEDGLLRQLGQGGIHLSMSTVSPDLARRLARLYARQASHYVTATVFGRPDAAAEGKLAIFLSGNPFAKERVLPLLQAMGKQLFDFGEEVQAATVVKLAANFLIASALEAMAEAAALVEKYEIDRSSFLDMIGQTLFGCPVYSGYGPMIAHHIYTPALFRIPLGLKDLRLCLETANREHVPLPLAHLVHDRLQVALNKGREELDWSALALSVAEDAGLEEPPLTA